MSEADEIFLNFPAHSIMQQSDFSPTKFLHSASHLTDKFSIWKDFLSEICGFFFSEKFSVSTWNFAFYFYDISTAHESPSCALLKARPSHMLLSDKRREKKMRRKKIFF